MTDPRYTKEAEALLVRLAEDWTARIWRGDPHQSAARAFLDAMKGGDCPARVRHQEIGLPVAGVASTAPPEPNGDERTVVEILELMRCDCDERLYRSYSWYCQEIERAYDKSLAAHRAEVDIAEQHASILREQRDELQWRINVAKACLLRPPISHVIVGRSEACECRNCTTLRILAGRDNREAGK